MTIRKKLYLMLFFVLFVIAAMTAITYFRGRSAIVNLVDAAGMDTVRASAKAIDERFDTAFSVLDTCAEVVRQNWLQKGVDEEGSIEDFLKGLLQVGRSHGLRALYFGLESTGRMSDASAWQEPEGYDARTRDWYRKAVEGKGRVVLSDPYVDDEVQDTVLSVSRAVYDDGGRLLGVMGGDILLDGLHDLVNCLQILDKGYGFLLLKNGLMLSGPHPEDIMKVDMTADPQVPEALREAAQRMIRGETGAQEYVYGGMETKAFFTPTGTGFFLAVAYPASEIRTRVSSLTFLLVVIAAVALVVIWTGAGHTSLLLAAGLASIPRELVEAARLDGATARQIFWSIEAPLLRPTLLLVATAALIAVLNTFDQVYALTRGGPDRATGVLAYTIYERAFVNWNMGEAAVMALVMTVMLLLVTGAQSLCLRGMSAHESD